MASWCPRGLLLVETSSGRLFAHTQAKRSPLHQTHAHPQAKHVHDRVGRLRARQTSQRRDSLRRHNRATLVDTITHKTRLGQTRLLLSRGREAQESRRWRRRRRRIGQRRVVVRIQCAFARDREHTKATVEYKRRRFGLSISSIGHFHALFKRLSIQASSIV